MVQNNPFLRSPFPPSAKDPLKPEINSAGNKRLCANCYYSSISLTILRPICLELTNGPIFKDYISKQDPDKYIDYLDSYNDCCLMIGTYLIA